MQKGGASLPSYLEMTEPSLSLLLEKESVDSADITRLRKD